MQEIGAHIKIISHKKEVRAFLGVGRRGGWVGLLPILMAYTRRLHTQGVPFSGYGNMKGWAFH